MKYLLLIPFAAALVVAVFHSLLTRLQSALLANEGEEDDDGEEEMDATEAKAALAELLELDDTATDADIREAIETVHLGAPAEVANEASAELANEVETLRTELTAALANEEKARAGWVASHEAHMTSLVNQAVAAGTIRADDSDDWIESLANDYATAWPQFEKFHKASLPTKSQTKGLGGRGHDLIANARERMEKVESLVNERMAKNPGETYDAAYATVKRENSALFAQMQQPTSSAS